MFRLNPPLQPLLLRRLVTKPQYHALPPTRTLRVRAYTAGRLRENEEMVVFERIGEGREKGKERGWFDEVREAQGEWEVLCRLKEGEGRRV